VGFALQYHSSALIESLPLGHCTIHRARDGAKTWWNLWIHVTRTNDGAPDVFVVPVIPNGDYTENGPGGRSWGLKKTGPGEWQVSPSINVLKDNDKTVVVTGLAPESISLWHQTPSLVYVPDGEPWQAG
jgi:hypothetical protein